MPVRARLLLVDEDESNRDLLSRRLLRSGYEVETAADGEQALRMARGQGYDLVLLDQVLCGMSGLETLRQIRETWSDSELPVIIITSLDESRQIVDALRMGANDYVTKPLDFQVMLARIEARLRLALQDREMRRSRELYRLALGASQEGLWDWDLASETLHVSPVWEPMFDASGDHSFSAEDWFSRIHPDDRPRVRTEVQAHLEGRSRDFESEYRMRGTDGQYRWIESRGAAARNALGKPVRLVGCHSDITVRKSIDPLTSLYNRAWLEQELRTSAGERERFALVLLELDSFDRIEENLSNGNPARLLAAVAARFTEALARDSEPVAAVIARAGERQFGLLLREASGPAAAKELAARLQSSLTDSFEIDGQSVFATASAGIAIAYGAVGGDDLLRDAAAALRHAREQGIGHIAVFQTFMRRDDLAEMRLDHDLHHAIERSEFEVWYQPKVDLFEDEIVGCEALVRWRRPGHGLAPPARFIAAAERNGVIGPLGRFVIERACRDIADLRQSYPSLRVSVNVSGRQLAEPHLVEQVRDCLDTSGLEPNALRLEITETFLVEDPERALNTLGRLRALGVGLKLDDFGSGYSSLDYLQKFPFDTLKIDRTFVSRVTSCRESVEIVRAIVGLARSLNLELIAEGIENRAQLECLKDLGCRYGQGYWFSPPVELARLRELLEEWRARSADTPLCAEPVGCGAGSLDKSE
jgi:diguanylate cyclase (GGDEF)-like protein/PAS domain S-box-containing protein